MGKSPNVRSLNLKMMQYLATDFVDLARKSFDTGSRSLSSFGYATC